mmetsp:Transcript_37906/g.88211  ORF Transcript_37906/g.88211 Transcript_37906/m.88211 type:complete len:95 (-) Transcript_37906:174-458(-)
MITAVASRASSVLPRTAAQKRSIVDGLVKVPSKITEMQALQRRGGTMMGADAPTWLKQGPDRVVAVVGLALCATSLGLLGSGFYNMANGVGKKD